MSSHPDRGRALAAEHRVPLDTVEFEGHRYVAAADLGLGRPVPLMVHGNARVYMSLVHSVAEKLLGGPVPRVEDYGYTARGRGSIEVPSLRLGGAAFEELEGVPVFDFTDEPDAPVQGMLGTQFLTSARAAVDFATDTLYLGVARAADPASELTARGYRTAPMSIAGDGRVTVDVTFPSLGRALPITPSTVANALTLHRPPFIGRVEMEASGSDHSPSRTSPAAFASDGIDFEIGGAAFRSAATFQDLAEYGAVGEESLTSFGMLGFAWMAHHGALIDYANRILSFKP